MAMVAEMNNTISLIKNFWPHLKFDKSDVINGSPNFVVDFFSNFIAELNEKMSYLLNEEIVNEFDEIEELQPEVVLYCKVARFLKKMKSAKFNIKLGDFYFPNPKKMYHLIKVCIHFVIFINNCLDEVSRPINENFKKFSEIENLKDLKRQYTEEISEMTEKYGQTLEQSDELKTELEGVKKKFEIMLKDKADEAKLTADMTAERDRLQIEVDNLEYEIKLLEDKHSNLSENVVTQEEYDNLISTEKYLQYELEQLQKSSEPGDEKIVQNIEDYEKFGRILSGVKLDSLPVELVHDLRTKVKTKEEKLDQLKEELEEDKKSLLAMDKYLEELKEKAVHLESFCEDFTEKMQLEESKAKKAIAFEAEKSAGYFHLIQQRKSEILQLEEEQKRVKTEEEILSKAIATNYEMILSAERKVNKNFYNILKRMCRE